MLLRRVGGPLPSMLLRKGNLAPGSCQPASELLWPKAPPPPSMPPPLPPPPPPMVAADEGSRLNPNPPDGGGVVCRESCVRLPDPRVISYWASTSRRCWLAGPLCGLDGYWVE